MPDRPHYVKIVRDAATPLDSLVHRVTEENAHALNRTRFSISEQWISVYPQPQDRDLVLGLASEEFQRAGWSSHSVTAPRDVDPRQPVVSMSFGHPRTKTRMGEPLPKRPRLMGFEIPMPDPSVPITTELIDYYAEQAAQITRALLAQQVVDEEGKMPGSPGQGQDTLRLRSPKLSTAKAKRDAMAPVSLDDDTSPTAIPVVPLFMVDDDD